MRYKTLTSLLFFAVFVGLAGCNGPGEEEAPPDEVGTPEQQVLTTEMIIGRMRPNVAPLSNYLTPNPVPAEVKADVLNRIRQDSQLYALEPNGRPAIETIAKDVVSMLQPAEANKAWEGLLFVCDAVDILDPGNTRTARYREKAQLYLRQPQVTLKGITQIAGGAPVVLLDLFLPAAPAGEQQVRWEARQGEEQYTLRLEEIMGMQGVRIRFTEINEVRELTTGRGTLNPNSSVR